MTVVGGAVLTVASSLVSILGVNLQKRSLRQHPRTPYHSHRLWWGGFLCVVLGAVGDFAALGMASPALVTALGGTAAMLCNVTLARRMHSETLERSDLCGMALALLGAGLISAFSPPLFASLAQLDANIGSARFVCTVLVQAAAGAGLWRRYRDARTSAGAHAMALCSGVSGSFSVMLGSIVCLALRQEEERVWHSAHFWVPLPLMLITVVLQIHLLSQALALQDVIAIYPVFQAAWTGCTAVSCVLLYGSHALLLVGLLAMAAGVHCLRRHPSVAEPTQYSEAVEESTDPAAGGGGADLTSTI